MATYAATRTKFQQRLRRSDVTTALLDGFLTDAVNRINRVLRIPATETMSETVLSDATYFTAGALAIPTDYVRLKDITVDDEVTLSRRDLGFVLALAAASTGVPAFFARRGSTWVFAPQPLAAYTVRVDYYAELPAPPVDETLLTTDAEDLIVNGALSIACDHFNDKRGDKFEARYIQILTDIQTLADQDDLSGGATVRPAFFYPDDDEDCH